MRRIRDSFGSIFGFCGSRRGCWKRINKTSSFTLNGVFSKTKKLSTVNRAQKWLTYTLTPFSLPFLLLFSSFLPQKHKPGMVCHFHQIRLSDPSIIYWNQVIHTNTTLQTNYRKFECRRLNLLQHLESMNRERRCPSKEYSVKEIHKSLEDKIIGE